MSGMDRLTEAAWADLLAESLQVATAQNGSRNASRLLKDYRDHCANLYTPSETTPSDKLSDEALDRAVRMTDSHTTVGMMARELLAHRRASQAAPAPSDALREALEKIRDGYGPNHLSKFALAIASAALSTPTEERQ